MSQSLHVKIQALAKEFIERVNQQLGIKDLSTGLEGNELAAISFIQQAATHRDKDYEPGKMHIHYMLQAQKKIARDQGAASWAHVYLADLYLKSVKHVPDHFRIAQYLPDGLRDPDVAAALAERFPTLAKEVSDLKTTFSVIARGKNSVKAQELIRDNGGVIQGVAGYRDIDMFNATMLTSKLNAIKGDLEGYKGVSSFHDVPKANLRKVPSFQPYFTDQWYPPEILETEFATQFKVAARDSVYEQLNALVSHAGATMKKDDFILNGYPVYLVSFDARTVLPKHVSELREQVQTLGCNTLEV